MKQLASKTLNDAILSKQFVSTSYQCGWQQWGFSTELLLPECTSSGCRSGLNRLSSLSSAVHQVQIKQQRKNLVKTVCFALPKCISREASLIMIKHFLNEFCADADYLIIKKTHTHVCRTQMHCLLSWPNSLHLGVQSTRVLFGSVLGMSGTKKDSTNSRVRARGHLHWRIKPGFGGRRGGGLWGSAGGYCGAK